MRWTLLLEPPATGWWNMALDDALLRAAEREGHGFLRLYAWSAPTLSFGRNEPALRRYDRSAIEAMGLAVVRRPTGGRAVWHEAEVTYAVAAPAAWFGSLRESYQAIHRVLARALAALGASVELAPDAVARRAGAERAGEGTGGDLPALGASIEGRSPAGPPSGSPCFASAAGGEIVTPSGRKLVGSAQLRGHRAFLQHGSILLAGDQKRIAGLLCAPAGGRRQGPLAGPAHGRDGPDASCALDQLVAPARASWAAVVEALVPVAAAEWGTPLAPGALEEVVRRQAEALAPRYRDAAWIWRR